MKTLNSYNRLSMYLMLVLTFCYPMLQIYATIPCSNLVKSEMRIIQGSLKNGLKFTLMPSIQPKDGIWLQMDCVKSQDEESPIRSLLLQHCLFYGTQKYSGEELSQHLNSLELDVEADSFIQSNETNRGLHFYLSHQQNEKVGDLLEMIHQMLFFPTLKDEEIELARNHLLEVLQEENKETLSLKSISSAELHKIHAQEYSPETLHLTMIGISNFSEATLMISEIFQSPVDTIIESIPKEITPFIQNSSDVSSASFIEQVEWKTDAQTYVIDGKIFMSEPNWINKSFNGKALGTFLTILGFGGMMLMYPVITPVVAVAGGMAAITGIYYLSTDYLKDPYYVETLRQTDLQKGCAYAYQNQRSEITLTPYERRSLFLQEMVQRPQILPQLPILLLADLYQLNQSTMSQIFTEEEFNFLTHMKSDFIQQRNQYKMLKNNLERELAALIAPHSHGKDVALLYATEAYEQNYYVVAQKNLKSATDKSISKIEQACQRNEINYEKRDQMIKQAKEYYDSCISDYAFKNGLELAKTHLNQRRIEIQATFAKQVELCKKSIHYYARSEKIRLGKESLIHAFNKELVTLLSQFPVYLSSLPDYLDLRGV